MIGPLSFGAPILLAALAVTPLVWGALRYGERRRADADRAVGGPAALRRGRSTARRRLRGALLIAAIAASVLAAARPQWGEEQRLVEQRGIDVALVLDVSRSMTATDVEPSRAHAAANALTGLLGGLVGDRGALVTFAGSALVRSPLTRDLEVLAQLVERAQSEAALMRPGSNVGVALQRALDALNVEDAARTQVIVLVSDGEDPAGERFVDFARETASSRGVRIYTAVAGAPGGGALPGPARVGSGPEMSVPNAALLADAARGTGGELRTLSSIPGLAVTFRRLAQTRFAEDTERAPVERFQWLAAAALVLVAARELVSEGRRGRGGRGLPRLLPASLVGALLGAALVASCGGSEAYRETRAGNEAFRAERYEEALARYEAAAEAAPSAEDLAILAYDRGNALGGLERYEEAMEAAAAAADETEDPELAAVAAYARGIHAARALRLEAARDAFVTALLRDPDDDAARANLEIVLRALGTAPGPEEDPAEGADAESGLPGPDDSSAGPGGQPTPAPAPGSPGGAQAGPGGAGTQPGAGPVPGGAAAPDGLAGQQPGPAAAVSAEEARAALEAALAELESGEMALEEALRLLDLVHLLNALVDLGGPRQPENVPPPR